MTNGKRNTDAERRCIREGIRRAVGQIVELAEMDAVQLRDEAANLAVSARERAAAQGKMLKDFADRFARLHGITKDR